MMQGWKGYKFNDIAYINRESVSNGYPFEWIYYLDTSSVTDNIFEKPIKIDIKDAPSRAKRIVKPDSIVYSTVRPNQLHFGYIKNAPENLVASTGFAVIKSKPLANTKFLYYWLRQESIITYLNTLAEAQTTTFPAINQSDIGTLDIDLPPLPVQCRIAEILGALDDKIELNRQINHTLEQMANTLYKHHFVDYIDPENLPEGWKKEPLSGVGDFLNGVALQKYPAKVGEPYLPAIKIKELNSGITAATEFCNANIPEKYLIDDGDLLFSWSGSLELTFWCYGKGALNQHLFKVTSVRFPKWFLYHWILNYLDEFRDIAAGKATTMGHIQRHHLDEAIVWYPPAFEFSVINQAISPLIENMIQNKIESINLTKIRDTLLPKLISGELIPTDLQNIEQTL